jgi:hypothetical protein
MLFRLKYGSVFVTAASIIVAAALISRWNQEKTVPTSLFVRDSLGKYDEPHVGLIPNDMADNSMGRTFSYSTGDQDVREYKFMQKKFNRLQAILDSIQNGPTLAAPEPEVKRPNRPAEPLEDCGKTPGFPCPARPKPGQPFLSYTQRIVRMLTGIQERINAAAKRQYILEDEVMIEIPGFWHYTTTGDVEPEQVASARKPRGAPGFVGPPGLPGEPGAQGPEGPPGRS